jgi:hypothetical protein
MHSDLPHLEFLSIDSLLIHERHDDTRTRPLVLRIRSSGVLRNPPVVSPLPDGSGRYMVLDGANRITALREMGFPHALVQVVQPGDPGLVLQNWNHVVWELEEPRFVHGLRSLPEVELSPLDGEEIDPDLEGDCGLVLVKTCSGENYSVCPNAPRELVRRVGVLNAVVDSYRERCRLDRTSSRDVKNLADIYPQLCGLVVFPQFHLRDVMRLAGQGYLLPTGITRFTISPRALHVNYPLSELAAEKPVEQKNAELHKWIQERVARKGVRYYAEATFLFDE